MQEWQKRLYNAYVSSNQGGQDASLGYSVRGSHINSFIRRHIPSDRQIKILDVGCGAGDVIYWLKKANYHNISGFDISPEMIELAHSRGVTEVKLSDINQAISETESNSIDVVICFDIFEHLSRHELFYISDEIFRILKPGGKIFVHTPNASGIFGGSIRYGDITHEISFTATSMRQLLRTVGFEKVSSFEDKPIPHGLKSTVRAIIWAAGTLGFRLLYAAETGKFNYIASQNFLTSATKPTSILSPQ
ncbi:class I SAM-dependent methyltransferase [Xanthobacter aminoxidans]|uniref:class I SAM-dependent methyltransferase n=1 Tax=Xanthobacter aminoxidans TaxID=186280 RepID=UPI003728B4AF